MWGSASRGQLPLKTGIVRWQFPSLNTTWLNGMCVWNGSHFAHHIPILTFTGWNEKCHVIIVAKTDLLVLSSRDWTSCFAIHAKLPRTSPGAPLEASGAHWDVQSNPTCVTMVIYKSITRLVHYTQILMPFQWNFYKGSMKPNWVYWLLFCFLIHVCPYRNAFLSYPWKTKMN